MLCLVSLGSIRLSQVNPGCVMLGQVKLVYVRLVQVISG
jgi:hypothetical protein